MNDDEFVAAFENGTLKNEDFHHADHVRMGFLYLSRFPVLEAVRRFSDSLQRLAAARGNPNLYHETITWAFLFLIRERLAQSRQHSGQEPSWNEFAAENPDLQNWKELLKNYYRDETLASELARRMFILPNRSADRSRQ